MDKLIIKGGRKLKGSVSVSGSKNSSLIILAATLLCDGKCVIENVPNLKDIDTMCDILRSLNVTIKRFENKVIIQSRSKIYNIAPYDLVRKMRASICVLGPLLARCKKAEVSLPGGCVIGPRPIDLHIKGLQELGAKIRVEHGYVKAQSRKLTGSKIYLGGSFGPSVLATANIVMASVTAEGKTIIENAACEPEIVDLVEFLIKAGAKIKGHGTSVIEVIGVKSLNGVSYKVISDRIEAGTYLVSAAITWGNVKINNCCPEHLSSIIDKFRQLKVNVKLGIDWVEIENCSSNRFSSVDISTAPYPGFPTDMQAQFMSLLTIADGVSIITENVYPKRFLHVGELNRMGADIKMDNNHAIVRGVGKLSGAPVMASDLRASAALILAGLAAEGETIISRIYHLDRGYERIEEKLSKLGAYINRLKEKEFV